MPREALIDIRELRTTLDGVLVHESVDLRVYPGEIVGIVGSSGSGKTTLLHEMIMLQRPSAGHIQLFGQDVMNAADSQIDILRRRIGVTFQDGALFSSLTVSENVAVPLKEYTVLTTEVIRQISLLKLALVGLPRSAADKRPAQLSGGMVKRAAVARAIALDPEILFFDEPTAGLDPVSAQAFDELILRLRDSLGLVVVIVTHDLDTLWRITDRVAFLGEGRILADAPIEKVSHEEHPLIRAFFRGPRGRIVQEQPWNQK